MENKNIKLYGYRWIVLISFMVIILANQLLWISFAPITGEAAGFYEVSDLNIGLLSMSFMVVFIVVSIPASWMIDKYGIRVAVGIGAALTGIFGLLRGILAYDYTMVLITQIGIALGQPFILNAITTVAARWFPLNDRATAAGLGSLAMYAGIFLGLIVTPFLTLQFDIPTMLLIYGIFSVAATILFFILVKERPPTSPCLPGQEERALVFESFFPMLRSKGFGLLMLVFFIGLGAFNAVTTWVEDIVRPRGFSITQAGAVGGLMIAGGIVGALILPMLSDRFRKRIPFIIIALLGATLGLLGITLSMSYGWLMFASFIFGFFLLSAGPIGFQYGAEISYPAPEGTSNGFLLLMGQISGIVFILAMDMLKSAETGSMTLPLSIMIGLMVVCLLLSFRLEEPSSLKMTS